MVQNVGLTFVVERSGIVIPGIEIAILGIELHVPADEQIDASVAVVIEPGRTDRPAIDVDPGLGRHIRKRTVALVAVQDRAPVAGHEKVDEAVIVKVGCNRRHAIDVRRHAGLVGHVREFAVAVIAIQMVVGRILRLLLQGKRMYASFERLATGHIEVEQAIVVVVEPDAASARALEQRTQVLRSEAMREVNPRSGRRVFEPNRARWRTPAPAGRTRERRR